MSEDVYKTLTISSLLKPSEVLYGPARQKLKVLGEFTGTLEPGVLEPREAGKRSV